MAASASRCSEVKAFACAVVCAAAAVAPSRLVVTLLAPFAAALKAPSREAALSPKPFCSAFKPFTASTAAVTLLPTSPSEEDAALAACEKAVPMPAALSESSFCSVFKPRTASVAEMADFSASTRLVLMEENPEAAPDCALLTFFKTGIAL